MTTRRDLIRQGGALAALSATGLGGCAALPRSGPMTLDIASAEAPGELEGLVAPLTLELAQRTPAPPPPGFPPAFRDARPIDPTRIGVDDVLDILIWESEGGGLLNAAGGLTALEAVVVSPSGAVFVPFAESQRAAGLTLAELRASVQRRLEALSAMPQVDVRLREPRSRLVSLQGAVARPGLYPIDRATARLLEMLAQAGGATDLPERIEIAVERDGAIGRQILAEVLDDPALNIALRPRDRIVLSPIRERFVVLGAASVQAEMAFPSRPLSLLSALGAARGLRDFDADPTGVFVFRREDAAFADALLPGPRPPGLPAGDDRPIVYRLDMSQPEGLFAARAFNLRDGDAIFVTNAPLTELRKFLQLFSAVLTPVQDTTTLAP